MLITLDFESKKKEVDVRELERLASVHGKDVHKIARALNLGTSTLQRRIVHRLSYKNAYKCGLEKFKADGKN